ncbi:MAG: 4a-hydroxytetrahydrobiopterin dehydratase [bacterium]
MQLKNKKCVPCEGGIPPLKPGEINQIKKELKEGWNVVDYKKLVKEFKFVNFKHTMDFVNKVANISESEGHHPDLHVSYSKCLIELWTHAIGGLSENDFILAAKIDEIN